VCKLNIGQQMRIQRRTSEPDDGLRNIVARSLNRDIVIFLKIYTGGLFGRIIGDAKELTLGTRIRRSGDMFAIGPTAVSGTPTITTTARVAICVGVKGALRAGRGSIPITTCSTRSERWGTGPTITMGSRTGRLLRSWAKLRISTVSPTSDSGGGESETIG